MELLAEISESDIGFVRSSKLDKVQNRLAARAIIFNDSNQIALLYVSVKNYHKLPGGGVEDDETVSEALLREVTEEVGAKIEIFTSLGSIIEHRGQHQLVQQSYCFLARTVEIVHTPAFTKEEQANGFQLKWVDYEQAVLLLENDNPKDYVGMFIQKRDLLFLHEMKKYFNNN